MPPSLYQRCTVEQAVTAFGAATVADFYCDRQFAALPGATLCFATMGDPNIGTKLLSPSKLAWKPTRLDYHPEDRRPWLPDRLTETVERDGAWYPLHHLFLRAAPDEPFVYAGLAKLPCMGDLSDSPVGGPISKAAHFSLDAKLPWDLWIQLGGYDGWLAGLNSTPRRFASADVAGFEKLLAGVPTAPGYRLVWLTSYEEQWFTIQFNARRAHLRYGPGGRHGVECWDPGCSEPGKSEFFGDDGQGDVVFSAGRTVARELAFRAAVEYFRTGCLPECVRWREIKAPA